MSAGTNFTSPSIIVTKIEVPPTAANLLKRSRLMNSMNGILSHRVTWISAPAGFGKTSLVSEWLKQSNLPYAWVSLDKGDNDLSRFWTYVIYSMRKIHTTIGQNALSLLQSPLRPSIETIISLLVNDLISSKNEHLILVLDDYHLIELNEIHESLSLFMEYLPICTHLCLISRSNSPLSLAKLRVKGDLYEIGLDELRFTPEEISEFFCKTAAVQITPNEIQVIAAQTEGWIAGLQLAAIAIKERPNQFTMRSVTGSNRYVADYLMEEVLLHFSEAQQVCLLQASILDRMNASLFNAVTGGLNGDATLKNLSKTNLFIIPLDSEQNWYRYHHLFADFLYHLLKQRHSHDLCRLHRSASHWFEQNDYMDEAIHHALEANDFGKSAELIAKYAAEFLRRGEVTTLIRWLDRLPPSFLEDPSLKVILAWTDSLAGSFEKAEQLLVSVENDSSVHTAIQNELDAVRNYIKLRRKDFSGETILPVLHKFAKSNFFIQKSGITFNLGEASNLRGYLGFCGRLRPAASFYDNYLSRLRLTNGSISTQDQTAAYFLTVRAEIQYEWNDLDGAAHFCLQAIQIAEPDQNYGAWIPASLLLARMRWTKGSTEESLSIIRNLLAQLEAMQEKQWISVLKCAFMRFYLSKDEWIPIDEWLRELELDVSGELHIFKEYQYFTLLRVLMRKQQWLEALTLSERLLQLAQKEDRIGTLIEVLALQSIVLYELHEQKHAMIQLHQALVLGEEKEYLRSFIDEGYKMQDLLIKYLNMRDKDDIKELKTKVSINYIKKILSVMDKSSPPFTYSIKDDPSLVTPLTQRELEILQLIASGLSNKEISQQLYLTVGTVKIHINKIYAKLGVKNRVQAITKGKALQLTSI